MTFNLKQLLWVDCMAGASVGVVVVLLSGWLSGFYGLPVYIVLLSGAANLAYAAYSFSLAIRPRRPLPLIALLVLANLSWTVVCWCLATVFSATATPFGLVHLVGEGLFVGGLACLEWKVRDQLLTAA